MQSCVQCGLARVKQASLRGRDAPGHPAPTLGISRTGPEVPEFDGSGGGRGPPRISRGSRLGRCDDFLWTASLFSSRGAHFAASRMHHLLAGSPAALAHRVLGVAGESSSVWILLRAARVLVINVPARFYWSQMQSPEAQGLVFVGGKIRFVFLVRRPDGWRYGYAHCLAWLAWLSDCCPDGLVACQSIQSSQRPGHTHAHTNTPAGAELSCLLTSRWR